MGKRNDDIKKNIKTVWLYAYIVYSMAACTYINACVYNYIFIYIYMFIYILMNISCPMSASVRAALTSYFDVAS